MRKLYGLCAAGALFLSSLLGSPHPAVQGVAATAESPELVAAFVRSERCRDGYCNYVQVFQKQTGLQFSISVPSALDQLVKEIVIVSRTRVVLVGTIGSAELISVLDIPTRRVTDQFMSYRYSFSPDKTVMA